MLWFVLLLLPQIRQDRSGACCAATTAASRSNAGRSTRRHYGADARTTGRDAATVEPRLRLPEHTHTSHTFSYTHVLIIYKNTHTHTHKCYYTVLMARANSPSPIRSASSIKHSRRFLQYERTYSRHGDCVGETAYNTVIISRFFYF